MSVKPIEREAHLNSADQKGTSLERGKTQSRRKKKIIENGPKVIRSVISEDIITS